MKLVALTGGIASGKTTVANIFKNLGCRIINADTIYWNLLAPTKDGPSDLAVKLLYNTGINNLITPWGKIDRELLRDYAFSSDTNRKNIESITKGPVEEQLKIEIDRARSELTSFCICEIPLLFEAGWDSWFDNILVVYVDIDTQIRRLTQRNNLTEEDAVKRIEMQLPVNYKLSKSTWSIYNNDIYTTEILVNNIFEKLKQ